MIDRRTFLAGIGAVLLAAPFAAEAQQAGKIARVGVLDFGRVPSPQEIAKEPFSEAIREVGWVEGQNIVIERRYGESADQLHASVLELVRLKVDVLVVPNCGLAKIAQGETKTIPIVIQGCGFDLVAAGLAASLARPGGNITGSQILAVDLIGKRFQLLKELVPNLSRVATLSEDVTYTEVNPAAQTSAVVAGDVAARTLGLKRDRFVVRRPEDFPAVFRGMIEKGDRGLLVFSSPFMWVHRKQTVDLAAMRRIAVIYDGKGYAEAGGLMSYGTSRPVVLRRTAAYVDKILKGAKPGDLPVEQPTKFEFVINLKTAKTLGLTIPPALLGRADEVIQ